VVTCKLFYIVAGMPWSRVAKSVSSTGVRSKLYILQQPLYSIYLFNSSA